MSLVARTVIVAVCLTSALASAKDLAQLRDVSFVGTEGPATDKDTWYKDAQGVIQSTPQGTVYPVGKGPAVVYTIQTPTVDVTVTFYNPAYQSVTGTFTFDQAEFVEDGNPLASPAVAGNTISLTSSSASITCPARGYGSTTVTLSGFPTYVVAGQLRWHYSITPSSQFNGPSAGMWNVVRMYRVNQPPVAPMEHPWVEMLNYGCHWAYGSTSEGESREDCTYGLFTNGVFNWSTQTDANPANWFVSDSQSPYDGFFRLKDVLEATTKPSGTSVDVSTFLHTTLSSLGCFTFLSRQFGDWSVDGYSPFWTNPVCHIGLDKTNDGNYGRLMLPWQQVVGHLTSVYDASLAQYWDFNGYLFKQEIRGWDQGLYWQDFDSLGNGPWGLVYRTATVQEIAGAPFDALIPGAFVNHDSYIIPLPGIL